MAKNKAAQALGRLCKGVPKTLTEEQREAKRVLLAKLRKRRWKGHKAR